MPFFDTRRQRAALLIMALGAGLLVALAPYASGVLGAPVIVALFAPLNRILRRRMRPVWAAVVVIIIAILVVILPAAGTAALLVGQAPGIARGIANSPLLDRLGELRIGSYVIGPEIRQFGDQLIRWIAGSALGLIGTATRTVLNLTIALFGAYFLLLQSEEGWTAIRPFIPFSDENVERLRRRFRDVTNSTVIGVLLVAVVQGLLLGLMFGILGLPNAAFWAVVTGILSILPVVGSGLVWVPACISLATSHRLGAAIALAAWGVAVVGSADNIIRPIVYRRWASIHPFATLVGAFAGIRWFGVLGILIGPLAVSYFFALIDMYNQEYIEPSEQVRRRTAEMQVVSASSPTGGNPTEDQR
jgi:predicted PurR-regulated permease PerM